MRTIKELLQLVLEGLIELKATGIDFNVTVHGGLCGMVTERWFIAKYHDITPSEARLYMNYISSNAISDKEKRANRPDFKSWALPIYWWPHTDIQSRINFIQNLINNIETNEAN